MREFSQGLSVRGLLRLERLMVGAGSLPGRLSLSNDITRRLEACRRLYAAFIEADASDLRELFDIFHEAGEASFDLVVIAGRMDLVGELKRFQRISGKPLINTEEVMEITGVGGGPKLGRILKDLAKRRFSRDIRGRRDAARWLSAQ